MTDNLSVILIQIDSLNRHFLHCYGNEWVETPHLTAFAEKAAVFDSHFTGSLPCMPARREIWAGTEEFWWRGWGPLEPWDRPIAYLAHRAEEPITTYLVTDHYHFFEWGSHTYNYDFHGYEFIRGHEYDNWRTEPIREVPQWAQTMVARRGEDVSIYLRNVQHFDGEADFFGPQVMQATAEWLDRNHKQPHFYLHIDAFDVHEPFHVPEPYRSMYTDADFRAHNPWPEYGRTDEGPTALSPEEIAWVRAQFAGKLTMVDRWLGRVFDRLERYNLWERTCVLITTDHGHFLGEHGWMGKPAAPLYHTLCHIPLLVWHPQGAHNGGRVGAMTQTIDLYATVLDLLGLERPALPTIHSRSLVPLITGETETHRPHALYGYHNERTGLTAGEWTLLRYQTPAAPPYLYTHQIEQTAGRSVWYRESRPYDFPPLEAGHWMPGVGFPQWRRRITHDPAERQPEPGGTLLFHNASDPDQQHDLSDERPEVVRQMEALIRAHAEAMQVPEEQLRRLEVAMGEQVE